MLEKLLQGKGRTGERGPDRKCKKLRRIPSPNQADKSVRFKRARGKGGEEPNGKPCVSGIEVQELRRGEFQRIAG